jgi:hypothetical protein
MFARHDAVALREGLADRVGHDPVSALRDVGQAMSHPVKAAHFHVASSTRVMAALRPVGASLITSFAPSRPRPRKEPGKPVQNGKRDQKTARGIVLPAHASTGLVCPHRVVRPEC